MDYSPDMEFALKDMPSLKGKVSDGEWQARVNLAASLPACGKIRLGRHALHPYFGAGSR